MHLLKLFRTFLIVLITSIAQQLDAKVYYASPTGSGEGISKSDPGDLKQMIWNLEAGDELILLDGQYDMTETIWIDKKGTRTAPIIIRADENATPILDFRNQSDGLGIGLQGEYTHLKGITIRYAAHIGIWNFGTYNILERLDVYGNYDTGIQNCGGGHNMIKNCDSHDNFDYKHLSDNGSLDYGGNADGFADKWGEEPYSSNVYIGCRAWNNSDDGFDFWERISGEKPSVVINCIAYHNGPETYDMTNHPRVAFDKEWFDKCGETLSAYKNHGNGNGFKLGGNGTKHNVELYRCQAVGNRSIGFDQNENAGKMKVINCMSFQNGYNYGFYRENPFSLDIHNCISLEPTWHPNNHFGTGEPNNVTQSHNSWNDGFSVSASDFESLDVKKLIIAPRNADGSLPEIPLFQLKSTASDLIDKGIDYSASNFEGDTIANYITFNGSAPDLGCYEYSDRLFYTVNEMVDGNIMRSTANVGSPEAEIVVPYRRYYVHKGKLYMKDASGGPKGKDYNYYFTLTKNHQVETINYKQTDVHDVVFLAEGEDIPGMTLCDNYNMRIRSSNSAAAYAANGPVGFVTLPAGSYQLTALIHNSYKNPDSYWSFLAGDKEIANLHCTVVNIQELQSVVFTLNEKTTLYIPKCGDVRSGIDLLYITKVMPTIQLDAKVYYASPTGSGEGISKSDPGDLKQMIWNLEAGDELILLDGQYDMAETMWINKKGTRTAPIIIRADEGAKPIIDFRNQSYGELGIGLQGEYTHLIGITVRYAGYQGLWNMGSHNILERIDSYGNCDSGIMNRDGGYNLIINCDSHDNFDYKCLRIESSGYGYGGGADGFSDKLGEEAYPANVYIGCRSWNNSDDGFDFYERKSGEKPTVLINCIAYHNGPTTYDMSNHPRLKVDKEWFDNCGETLSAYKCYGHNSGFVIGGAGTKHDVELYRCLAVDHRNNGFDQNDNSGKVKIINCTAFQNYANYAFWFPFPCTLDIHNCISLEPTGGIDNHFFKDEAVSVIQSHNSWNDGFDVSASDFESLDVENLIIAPRNADGSLPEIPQFQLKSTASNLIDKGVVYLPMNFEGDEITNYVDYNGTAPDLGCYEYTPLLIGDVNGDNIVNAADIVEVINYITDKPSAIFNASAADMNNDGVINADDITEIMNIIMTAK